MESWRVAETVSRLATCKRGIEHHGGISDVRLSRRGSQGELIVDSFFLRVEKTSEGLASDDELFNDIDEQIILSGGEVKHWRDGGVLSRSVP